MNLKSNIVLQTEDWPLTDYILAKDTGKPSLKIFGRLVDVFIICAAIGIYEDKTIDSVPDCETREIAKITLVNNSDVRSAIDFMYQNAVLTSNTIDFNDDQRKELAFNPDTTIDFNQVKFLIGFANYGMNVLAKKITNLDTETIDNIRGLINSLVEEGVPDSTLDETLEEEISE